MGRVRALSCCKPIIASRRSQTPLCHVSQALAVNLWVLAIMCGIVAIIIAGKARIHVPEPLAHVHATNGVLPYIMPVESESM